MWQHMQSRELGKCLVVSVFQRNWPSLSLMFSGSIERISCLTELTDYSAMANRRVLKQVASLLRDKSGRTYRHLGNQTEERLSFPKLFVIQSHLLTCILILCSGFKVTWSCSLQVAGALHVWLPWLGQNTTLCLYLSGQDSPISTCRDMLLPKIEVDAHVHVRLYVNF